MMLFLFCFLQAVQGGTIALEPDFDLVSFTPQDGSRLSGREALTVVFNLAVIPLGADLGDGPLPEDYVPFALQGAEVPGHLRWVSSSTARFDPSIDWPSDLKDIVIEFNSRIRSVSGKSLSKPLKTRHFSTAPLAYWVRDVKSKTAEKLTDNCWSSSLEEEKFKPKGAHECPFDAKVQISFNFPVVVDRFVKDPSMLELTEGGILFSHRFPITTVEACAEEVPTPLHLDLGGPVVVNQSRCLEVSFPILKTGGDYRLELLKGARYHPFAGPYDGGDNSDPIKLTGLRPFRFKFLKQRYRRELFKIYLRHGLKDPESSLEQLERAFSVTNLLDDGQVLPHELSLKSNSTLQLKVHGLQPEEEYVISVSPPGVFDGMGLPLEASEGRLKMGNLPGVFLAPQPPNPRLWTSTCSDRFMPHDAPENFPLLQRQPPLDMVSSNVDPEARMQAFVCSILSTNDLGDFLTFFFSPDKADTSTAGPCSKRSFQAHPGVMLVAGKNRIQFNEIPLNFPKSRLLFLEFTCVGKNLGSHCATERPNHRARFLNAASFSAVVAFAGPSSSPNAALGEPRHTSVLVSVHTLADQKPAGGYQVEVWEIPSTQWIGGRTIQPPAKRIGSESSDAHGRALFTIPEEVTTRNRLTDEKGLVVVVVDPKSGEILLGDLLRLPPSPSRFRSESHAFAASLRLSVTTDRAVYAPGDALALMGVIASIGSNCAGKPGSMCSPTSGLVDASTHSAYIFTEFIWRLDRPGKKEVCSVHPWPVSPMGMFAANITVPENASIGRLPAVSMFYAKDLMEALPTSCLEWRHLRSRLRLPSISTEGTPFLDLLIADPRPPSAVLTLEVPQFLYPGQLLKMNATLKTYTGIPLQQHELQVELTKHGKPKGEAMPVFYGRSESTEDSELSSDLVGKTDAIGSWMKELHFGGDVLWVPKLDDEVTVKVKARGPTGEMLTQSKKVSIRVGPWDVKLRTSAALHQAEGPLPGQDFAVWMSLKAKYPQNGWTVAEHNAARLFLVDVDDDDYKGSCSDWLRAKEKAQDTAILAPDILVDHRSCKTSLDPKSSALCYFRLPKAGRFAMVAKVKLQDGALEDHTVSSCTFLGRTAKEWRQSPLSSPNIFKRFEARPTAAYYVPGDVMKLQVWNPLPLPTRMLVVWGDRPAVRELPNVSAQETVDLGVLQDSDCPMTSCKVHVFLWSITDARALVKDVPFSIHYPEGAPLWAHQEVELRIERPGQILKVELKPEAKSIKPGGSVEIEVNIKQQDGAQTELSMLVVDKAWLDLHPLDLQEPTETFEPEELLSKGPQWRLASTLDSLATATSLLKATKRIRQSFKDNPWMGYISWPLALHGSDDSMLDDEHYMDKWAEELTDFPNPPMFAMDDMAETSFRGGPLVMAKGMAPMALMAESTSYSENMGNSALAADVMDETQVDSAKSSPTTTLRKRFAKLVALNRALLESGVNTWKTSIRLPEDLSSYTIRVLAVSRKEGNWSWGVAETEVHTAQKVYGKPLLPRMLRFGDVCRMGVAVQATAAISAPNPLVIEVVEPHNLHLLDKDTQALTMTGTSAEVRFTFAADIALGSASVIFKLKDSFDEILDMVEATIEVEEQQQGVRMASTASIQADSNKAVVRNEAIAALKAVPGYGEMTLSASVGFQAPLLEAIMEFAPLHQPWQPQGETLLAILLGGHVLQMGYGMKAPHEGLAAAISAAADRLAGQVVWKPLLGFVSTPPEQRQWLSGKQEPDLDSNAYALLVLRMAASLGVVPTALASLDKDRLLEAAKKAIELRRAAWKRCCADRISLASFIGRQPLAVFFLAAPDAQRWSELDILWQDIQQEAIKEPEGSDLDLLVRLASGQLGANLIMNFGADRRAEGAGAALLDRIRVQGPTAYFAQSEGSMHAASTWVQALSLWLWAGTKNARHPFAPLVASRLLSGERYPWQQHLPARDMIMSSIALLAFDSATGSSSAANIPLQIIAEPSSKKLLQVTLGSSPDQLLSSHTAWPWNELPPELATSGLDLEFQAAPGSGLAVVSYGLNFMPMSPFLEPQFRGILVQKIVQRTNPMHPGRCNGQPVTTAFPGETLCVTIQITSPDDLQEVVVVDLVPAGLEPIDEKLSQTDDLEGNLLRRPFFGRMWDREIRHDSVRWRAGFLWAGTHTLSFNCLANAPGLYSLPAAKAYSEKHAEVMGLSGAASFLVEETAITPNAVSAPLLKEYRLSVWAALKVDVSESTNSVVAPIACPQACPPAGSCNVAKGRCECASSSGELLPCEEVFVEIKAPFSKFLGNRSKQDSTPPLDGHGKFQLQDTPEANMPNAEVVMIGLFIALVAAAVYSCVAKTKIPRNFSEETELGSQPFTAMPDSATVRRRDPHRDREGGLVEAEAAE